MHQTKQLRSFGLIVGGIFACIGVWPALWRGHNTRLILGVLFYGIFTPLGLCMRLRGQDPMRRTLAPEVDTYRVVRQPRPATHMRHQF